MKKNRIILGILNIIILIISIIITIIRSNLLKLDYSNYYIHISIDDTIDIFEDITINENRYDSIFENGTLNFCKNMHDEYGAVFSFYVFYENNNFNLNNCTNKFKNEFISNSDWLKFNFHANDSKQNFNEMFVLDFEKKYEKAFQDLVNIVGTESIDSSTRLTMFTGNEEILNYLSKDTKIFYTPDDKRKAYYFDENISNEIFNEELYVDNNIMFIKSDLRLDDTENPFFDIYKIVNNSNDNRIEIFTHEWLLNSNNLKSDSLWKIEEICNFAQKYNLRFSFN